jgi:hypothetical protein
MAKTKTEVKESPEATSKVASSVEMRKLPLGKPFVKNDPRINRAGRRIGSRNKFSQAFTDAMLLDFEVHGESVIAEVRQKDPSTYVRIATALIPSKTEQEIEVRDTSSENISEIDWDIIVGGKS